MTPISFPNLHGFKFAEARDLYVSAQVAASELERLGDKRLAVELFQLASRSARELDAKASA